MIGGFTYTTRQGDMWDYIAWKVYGDEAFVYLLYRENPKYLETFIFNEGVQLVCPEVDIVSDDDGYVPDWMDDEDEDDNTEDALDGVSDEGDEDDDES